MLPDWLPNIHPLIVHFPVALLIIALLFDGSRLVFKKPEWLAKAAVSLYGIGTIGLAAAFFSGRHAVETVHITGDASVTVASHEDWALYTLIFFLIFTSSRIWTWYRDLEKSRIVLAGSILLGITGSALLWQTAELGAQMVYKHGIGAEVTNRLRERMNQLEQDLQSFRKDSAPIVSEDGSWSWRSGPVSHQVIRDTFTIIGDEDFNAQTGRDGENTHIEIEPGNAESFLVFGEPVESIEGTLEVNTEQFYGEIKLIHHFRDEFNYQFLKLKDDELIQGQIVNGNEKILQTGRIDANGWLTLRVSAAGTHFYGYNNQQTVTHTHGEEMDSGLSGISFLGGGLIKIRYIGFQVIG